MHTPTFCSTVLLPGPMLAILIMNVTTDILLIFLPFLIVISMRKRRRSEVWGLTLLIFLGTVSIVITVYRVVMLNFWGRKEGMTLSKRNVYVIQTMIMIVTMLGAFVIPSLRVLVRKTAEKVGVAGRVEEVDLRVWRNEEGVVRLKEVS